MAGRCRIDIRKSAQKEIRAVTRRADRERLVARILLLADDPRPPGCRKLSGRDAYRVRQGSYRILYTVADDVLVVEIIRVGDRRDVYE